LVNAEDLKSSPTYQVASSSLAESTF
jgi:hypothetical protein